MITTILVSTNTRTGTEDIAASTCCFIVTLTGNVALEDFHFRSVTHMTVLATAIDRAPDGGTSRSYSSFCCGTTDIHSGLIDIA